MPLVPRLFALVFFSWFEATIVPVLRFAPRCRSARCRQRPGREADAGGIGKLHPHVLVEIDRRRRGMHHPGRHLATADILDHGAGHHGAGPVDHRLHADAQARRVERGQRIMSPRRLPSSPEVGATGGASAADGTVMSVMVKAAMPAGTTGKLTGTFEGFAALQHLFAVAELIDDRLLQIHAPLLIAR